MAWISSVAGAALIILVLWDAFHTIFHPNGEGRLSGFIAKGLWRVAKAIRGGRPHQLVGPAAMVAVVGFWLSLTTLGFALIYLPQLDGGFLFPTGLEPGQRADFVDALYLSLVTGATLGYGDIVPTYTALKLVSPLQALTGFALLTAALSWVLQLYPALARRRALALRIHAGVEKLKEGPLSHEGLLDLSEGVMRLKVDTSQNSEMFYFVEDDKRSSVAAGLPRLWQWASDASIGDNERDRAAGGYAISAMAELAGALAPLLDMRADADPFEVLRRFATSHGGRGEK